jgi:hypothetical protein
MYAIFVKSSEHRFAKYIPPKWEYYRRMYQRELSHVSRYYRDRKFLIDNRNVFIRLIRSLYTPIEYDDYQYVRVVETKAKYFTKTYGFTSEISAGTVHHGPIYGTESEEILIYDESSFNIGYFKNHWKEAITAKPLDHPISDLMLVLPDGSDKHVDKGISFIKVHVAQMMLQYKYFKLEHNRSEDPLIREVGDHVFVTQYVLNNMLGPHLDIAILNRMINLYYGKPMGAPKKKLPFITSMFEEKLDRFLEEYTWLLRNKNVKYEWLLGNIPAVSKPSMLEVLKMPDLARTRQIEWALYSARIKQMLFLIDIAGEKNKRFNRSAISQLKRDVYLINSDQVLTNRYKGIYRDDLVALFDRVENL